MFTHAEIHHITEKNALRQCLKRNVDFRAKPKGLCIFIVSLNLWDLALDKKK